MIGKLAVHDGKKVSWGPIQQGIRRALRRGSLTVCPVAQTCRALREEVLPYFYQTQVTICILSTDSREDLARLGDWVHSLDQTHRAQLRGVSVVAEPHVASKSEWANKAWDVWKLDFEMHAKADNPNRFLLRFT